MGVRGGGRYMNNQRQERVPKAKGRGIKLGSFAAKS